MADNIVVIGKGKLIAETSVSELINKNGHKGVFVRTPKIAELESALADGLRAAKRVDGGLLIDGAISDDIGKLAFDAQVPLLELTNRSASLEEAFLELTADSQEYNAHSEAKV